MPAPAFARRPPERPLLLSIDLVNGRVTAAGELDRPVAHRLADALHALSTTGHRTWTVDAAGITFCDAEGLRRSPRAPRWPRTGAARCGWSPPHRSSSGCCG